LPCRILSKHITTAALTLCKVYCNVEHQRH